MKKSIKVEELKFIEESEVPKVRPQTPWEEIFSAIPPGKATVFEPEQVSPSTVRTALKRYQKKGKFVSLRMTARKIAGGRYKTYVVNSRRRAQPQET